MAKKLTKKIFEIALTDTHLNEKNIESNVGVFKQAIDFAKKNNITQIQHFGDVFDSRKAQPLVVLNAFSEILEEFRINEIKLCVIAGNHDKVWYASAHNFIEPFNTHPWLDLTWLSSRRQQDGIIVDCIPFFADEEYSQELKGRKEAGKGVRVLYTHIGITGAVMNNGVAVETSLSLKDFSHYDAVYIGHYHDAQSLNSKVHYVGASLQHNFGESEYKGLTVIYDDLSFETIPLDFPRYIKKEIDVAELDLKEIKAFKEEHKNDKVRIVLTGKKEELKSFNGQQLIDLGVHVKKKEPVIQEEELKSRVEPFTSATLAESFKAFCKERKLDHKEGIKYFNQINFKSHV